MNGFIRRVHVKNYRSLANVTVNLGRLTILVGPNGAGKSNFLDALRFVADALNTTVANAVRDRGGINAVRRRSRGHPHHFGIRIDYRLSNDHEGFYAFELTAAPKGAFSVKEEKCVIFGKVFGETSFVVKEGEFVQKPKGIEPRVERDRLALVALSASPTFRPVFDLLSRMQFYSLVPDRIRELQDPDPGILLRRDGSNAAAVLREIQQSTPNTYRRLCNLLSKVVPGTNRVEHYSVGPKESLRFFQDIGDKASWRFNAINMSDGTLRVLGILLAIYQEPAASLVAIEEPESTIHPAAADVLVDIFVDGEKRSQILITTHSPDILDNKEITDEHLRVVESVRGETRISPLNPISRQVVRDKLYSSGELLRMNQLEPDRNTSDSMARQMSLFGDGI